MTLTAELLAMPLSTLLGSPVTLRDWQAASLSLPVPGVPGTSHVQRVRGRAVVGNGRVRNWSLVVKELRSPAGAVLPNGRAFPAACVEDATSFGYWRREALFARSKLATTLPDGLSSARCFGVTDLGNRLLLWQEDLPSNARWTWANYREAAYRLGVWQGMVVTGARPLPHQSWLAQGWLRGYCAMPLTFITDIVTQLDGWEHPVVRRYLAPDELAELQRVWQEREATLIALDALPQTWSHLDAHRGNLFWRGDDLVLIDWSFSGRAALGEELAGFIGGTLLLDQVALRDAAQLEAVAIDGYTAGLRDTGWWGDTAVVEQAYRTALPLRYALMSLASMLRTATESDHGREWSEQAGKPLPELLHQRAAFIRFVLRTSLRRPVPAAGGADSG